MNNKYKEAIEFLAKNTELPFSLETSKTDEKTKVFFESTRRSLIATRIKYAKKTKHLLKKIFKHSVEPETISFEPSGSPMCSIVIPVLNKKDITLSCLKRLSNHQSTSTFEVIVVNNGSDTDTTTALRKVSGICLVDNESNLGFVGGCNKGAKSASGEILVFLNNDTLVEDNWLDELVLPLNDEGIGLSGSKLIYPDGTLQEAGGVIFNDGSGNNYGKHDDAGSFNYNYITNVDYVSGASIAIKKSLFEQFTGFDKIYQPAYYEDTDLAFKVRDSGLRVVYTPYSVVVHIEGATSGTDTTSGFKRYQEINRDKFVKRWKKTLSSKHLSPDDNLFMSRTKSYKKRILILENSLPEPNKDAGSLRQWQIIEILVQQGYFVTFWPDNSFALQPYTEQLQRLGVEVAYGVNLDFMEFMKSRKDCYDVVWSSRPFIAAKYIETIKQHQPNARRIYDTVDLHFLREERKARIEKSEKGLEIAQALKEVEYSIIRDSESAIVVSTEEKKLLQKDGHENIIVLPTIHQPKDVKLTPPFNKRSGLLFIGNYQHQPNLDAVVWFVDEILPLAIKKNKSIEINIVGSNADLLPKRLNNTDNVNILGHIENLETVMDSARLFVSPLRFGAGVKGKIGESAAHGLPVIATKVSLEGMGFTQMKDVLVADGAQQFAKTVIDAYDDEKLWGKLQSNASKLIDKWYSPERACEIIVSVIE